MFNFNFEEIKKSNISDDFFLKNFKQVLDKKYDAILNKKEKLLKEALARYFCKSEFDIESLKGRCQAIVEF